VIRRFVHIVLFLAAGFAAAFIVAAAACLWSGASSTSTLKGDRAQAMEARLSNRLDWGPMTTYDSVTCELRRGPGVTHIVLDYQKPGQIKRVDGRLIQWTGAATTTATEYGWPLRCFIADNLDFRSQSSTFPQPADFRPSIVLQRVRVMAESSKSLVLPMILNALLYSAGLYLIIVLSRRLRRSYRQWRGRCPQCGYIRGSADQCTECGTRLAPSRDMTNPSPPPPASSATSTTPTPTSAGCSTTSACSSSRKTSAPSRRSSTSLTSSGRHGGTKARSSESRDRWSR